MVCIERAGDVGIGVLAEADVRVADLHEQRSAALAAGARLRGQREIERRQHPAGQGEERAGAARRPGT